MKTLILFSFIFFLAHQSQAQNSIARKLDSLVSNASYEQALKLVESQSPSPLLLNKKAEVLMAQGKLDDAEKNLLQIDFSHDQFLQAITETNFGFLYLLRGRSDLALDKLQHGRDDFKSSGQTNTPENAKCLADLCLLYWSNGKYNQAEENGIAALQLRQSIFGTESEQAAASLNDLGLVYGMTDPDKALTYYEQALAIYEKLHPGDHPKIAIAKTNIGLMYLKADLYGDAVNNFESAQAIWKKNYPEGHPNEALALVNLGRTYSKMKDTKAALAYYERALGIYKKSYGGKHPDLASVYNQIGNIRLSASQYPEAIASFQQGLVANSPGFNSTDIRKNPPAANFYNSNVLLFSLQSKAEALEAQHYGKTLKLSDLSLALQTLQSCDTLIDLIRHQSENENDKIELGALASEAYEDGVRLAMAVSEMTVHSRRYKEIAFYFAEKSKSAVLQESIADAQAKSFSGIPSATLEEEKNRKSLLTFLAQKLSEKPGEEEEKKLRGQLFNATGEYESFIKRLEKEYPEYYNLKFSPATASVTDLQKTLAPDQAVVSYFIAEKNRRLYQFTVTIHRFHVRSRPLPENFERLCKGFTNSLLFNDFSTYLSTAPLAQLLKPSLPGWIKRLTIIPSGRLSAIPFEALTRTKITSKDFNGVSYFINRWAINYEFAAGLMVQSGKKQNQISETIFLCAPIDFKENQNLSSLPGTEKEVNTIAQLFSGKSKISTYGEANEEVIKSKEINQYGYLHFATHGVVDVADPALSRIFLNGKNNEDGNLFSGEIYNLSLHANLVVLSACETGLGKISSGEGVIGLSRALVYAGADNIIVSFWKVADESTAELMVDFYKNLLADKRTTFSTGLQQAKLAMIKSTVYASPYYWAPFVLIGK
jgi:tetratricopeptide (TPR) repeat protein